MNPAAIACTRFNARLNGIDNIECRQGSFMEPVAGEQFDLIVSNPPFVMSPENDLLYRDGGMRGDELSRQVLRDVAESLREGGLATVMISWGRQADDQWDATPRGWLEGSGCDAWILHQISQPALMHAASWHQQLAPLDVEAYDRSVARWTEYLTGLGFDAVAYGAVVLRRRRGGGNWIRSEDMPEPTPEPASRHLERMTSAQDALAGLADRRSLLDEKLTLVEGHRLDQSLVCKDGTYTVEQAVLRLTEGLQFRANVDAFNAFLVTRLDGTRTLREAIAEAAAAVAGPAVDAGEVESAALRSVRRMVELGFLRVRGSK